ncbi:hypothetical protein ANN_02240 [Periplaneta americana]|uniref:Ionotropic glutamate receptor L-glutamate and glycine-binding domain-containing protein n=1 Tax=Periplaneta americana TaxID=6978 RepID=A0ABQ8TZY2_PERAM|nr:hypothetical protein ANN_02240 [Periplaneta americana]
MFLLYIALLPGLCSSEPDEAIFQLVANLLQHYRSRYATLLFSWPESDFETTKQLISLTRHLSRRGIMALTLDFQEYLLYQGDLSCSLNVIQTFDFKTTSFLRKASESNKLSRSRWLLLPNPATDKDFSSLAGVHIPFDCEFIVAQRAGASVHLTEVYRVSEATSLRSEHYGTWSRVTGLRGIPHKRLYCRRDNLEGLNLLGVTSNSSSTLVYPGKDKKVKSIGGFFGALWSLLEERINFTTTFSTPEDDAWGSLESNGSWNGMIGMLQRSQAQVAVTMFSMTLQRKDVVDFTVPITLMRYAMYIQEKTLMKPNWMSFFAPFSQMLWITIIITIAAMVAFLAAMNHWLGTSSIGHMDSLFIVFTVFTQQGRTTDDAILSLLESAYNGFQNKMYSEVTLFDLTKAFDCVSYEILRLKLHYYGINGRKLDLLSSYMTCRKQILKIQGVRSFEGEVQHNDPQAPHPPLKPLSSSVAILTSQLTVLVLMAAYSGTLISFLTVRKIFMPFTDLAGFLKDGSYQLGVIEKTSEYDYFAVSVTS